MDFRPGNSLFFKKICTSASRVCGGAQGFSAQGFSIAATQEELHSAIVCTHDEVKAGVNVSICCLRTCFAAKIDQVERVGSSSRSVKTMRIQCALLEPNWLRMMMMMIMTMMTMTTMMHTCNTYMDHDEHTYMNAYMHTCIDGDGDGDGDDMFSCATSKAPAS